jgi:hypothetical protein
METVPGTKNREFRGDAELVWLVQHLLDRPPIENDAPRSTILGYVNRLRGPAVRDYYRASIQQAPRAGRGDVQDRLARPAATALLDWSVTYRVCRSTLPPILGLDCILYSQPAWGPLLFFHLARSAALFGPKQNVQSDKQHFRTGPTHITIAKP